jgi:hypothetical protein
MATLRIQTTVLHEATTHLLLPPPLQTVLTPQGRSRRPPSEYDDPGVEAPFLMTSRAPK